MVPEAGTADQVISTRLCGCLGGFTHPQHPGRQIPQLISDNNKQLFADVSIVSGATCTQYTEKLAISRWRDELFCC